MGTIEVRIQATDAFCHCGTSHESRSFFLDMLYPENAAGILSGLLKQNALEQYISEYSIPAYADSMPLLLPSRGGRDEFVVSLRSTRVGAQRFIVRIINRFLIN